MAETRFIKTVEFGGYDRNDVIKRLEFLNSQVFDLRNELRETKLITEEYKKGSDEEKAHETVLAQEKVKLTSLQVQNETTSAKLKAAEEDKAKLEEQLAVLKAKNQELTKDLDDVRAKLQALTADNEATALSQVFIAAQASANALVENANKEAETKKAETEELVREMIDDANHTAAEIVYEAEKRAAETDAQSRNDAEKMKVASNNLRAEMLGDVEELSSRMAELDEVFSLLKTRSADVSKLLRDTENKLTAGGVPEFRVPETFTADIPEAPEPRKTPDAAKKSNAKLEELQKMAEALNGSEGQKDGETVGEAGDNNGKAEENTEKPAEGKKSGGIDLAELMKQANELKG